jgi:hypothetical protein
LFNLTQWLEDRGLGRSMVTMMTFLIKPILDIKDQNQQDLTYH